MTADVWQRDSARLVTRAMETIQPLKLRSVALYACIDHLREVDLSALDPWLRARGTRLAYPFMRQAHRGFAWVSNVQTLRAPETLFRQPEHPWDLVEPGELDLIIVPMLGFAPDLNRVGYGAGFYDEMLQRFRPPALALGVAFQMQALSSLPLEPHDQRCDLIITEQGQYGQLPP